MKYMFVLLDAIKFTSKHQVSNCNEKMFFLLKVTIIYGKKKFVDVNII